MDQEFRWELRAALLTRQHPRRPFWIEARAAPRLEWPAIQTEQPAFEVTTLAVDDRVVAEG